MEGLEYRECCGLFGGFSSRLAWPAGSDAALPFSLTPAAPAKNAVSARKLPFGTTSVFIYFLVCFI